jgi:hypothetical protein
MVLSSKYCPRNIPILDSGAGGNLRDCCGGGEEDCGEAGGVKIPWAKVCMAKMKSEKINSLWMEKGP